MFERVVASKSRAPVNVVAIVVAVAILVGGFWLYRWYQSHELDKAMQSVMPSPQDPRLILPDKPAPAQPAPEQPGLEASVQAAIQLARVDLPDGGSVVMRGKVKVTGDAGAGGARGAKSAVAWGPVVAPTTLDTIAKETEATMLRDVGRVAASVRLARRSTVQVDGHDGRYLVFTMMSSEFVWLTITTCGDRFVVLTTADVGGDEDMATMIHTFHCGK